MVQKYIDQADRANESAPAAEELHAGEFLHLTGAGEVRAADAQDGVVVDGLQLFDDERMVGRDEDDVVDEVIAAGELSRHLPFEAQAVVYGRTPEDAGQTAPAITDGDVVGLVDTSSGDAPAELVGRLVEEGYSNGTTTFNRSNGNFVAVGRARRPGVRDGDTVDGYDEMARVQLFAEPRE